MNCSNKSEKPHYTRFICYSSSNLVELLLPYIKHFESSFIGSLTSPLIIILNLKKNRFWIDFFRKKKITVIYCKRILFTFFFYLQISSQFSDNSYWLSGEISSFWKKNTTNTEQNFEKKAFQIQPLYGQPFKKNVFLSLSQRPLLSKDLK